MTSSKKRPKQHHLFFVILLFTIGSLLLVNFGCAKKTEQDEIKIPAENLYIDAKLGFTIQHPLSWDRIKVPVSSPSFRRDSVIWDIPDQQETGIFLIRIYPSQNSPEDLTQLMNRYLDEKKQSNRDEARTVQLDSGEAISTTVNYPDHKERVFIIQGKHNAFLLSYYFRNEVFSEQLHLFERSVESFREF